VPPTSSRIPREILNNPGNERIGIVNPMIASAVRDGRVIRFCQAKPHMTNTPEREKPWMGRDLGSTRIVDRPAPSALGINRG